MANEGQHVRTKEEREQKSEKMRFLGEENQENEINQYQ